MADAARRYDTSAQKISTSATGSADLADDIVSAQITAPAAYAANAQMFRAADAARGSLLDILA